MIHQPVHPYVSAKGWLEYHRATAAAVPELGVVPHVRDAQIDGERPARLADAAENVIGLKYAVPDPARFAAVARESIASRGSRRRSRWRCSAHCATARPAVRRTPGRNTNNVSVVKEALAQLGLCRADVRPPSRPLTGGKREQVCAALAGWGLF